MKYGEGKRFLANYLCNVELLSFLLFSRNNCRDNVASVWIPLVFLRVGEKSNGIASYNSRFFQKLERNKYVKKLDPFPLSLFPPMLQPMLCNEVEVRRMADRW